MRSFLRTIFLCVLLLGIVASASAESVVLKSGLRVEGKIIKRTQDRVIIDFEGTQLFYNMDEVERINGEPVRLCQIPATSSKQCPRIQGPMVMFPEEDAFTNPCALSAFWVFVFAFALLLIIALSLFYLYFSLCLFFIAKKTAQEPAWLSFVPFANIFFMCKLAGVDYGWLWLLLFWGVPFLGPAVNLGLFTFLWYKIADRRNKPAWLGIFTIIPVFNLIVMGYLAFSE